MSDRKMICCERCGAPSHVRLSNMYNTVFLCLDCYDKQCAVGANLLSGGRAFDAERLRGQLAGAMVVAGTLIAAGTAAADFLQLSSNEGFGWKQVVMLMIGLLLMASGALFRIGVLGAVGSVCAFMAIFADGLPGAGDAGFAVERTIGVTLAAILIGTGSFIARKMIAGSPDADPDDAKPGAPPMRPLQTPAH